MTYDSRKDTLDHIAALGQLMGWVESEIGNRLSTHDVSKLLSPEKEMYDVFRPMLDGMSVDSPEYKSALAQMGDALKHHYQSNRHHPEHFENGINGMTLIDLIEMVCDWIVAAKRKNPDTKVNLTWARNRFEIDDQLAQIIQNTLIELEPKAHAQPSKPL